MVTHFGFFHKSCYNCHDCHISLDASKACELGTNKEIFCKNCYRYELTKNVKSKIFWSQALETKNPKIQSPAIYG